ncbi:centrosomal protein of 55 kDa [Astyanax mexicanus]|uniref:Centrosomal protein of 55 kDa-like n=1 Tax=Astyanax mexicanus TaxID=7994 RepID=A0A3B1KGD2_ASTMX|nr:centrosomal protein of 55 kDa [Astyanax mexicanus]
MVPIFPKVKSGNRAGRELEAELSELRKENAYLKNSIEELVCQKGAQSEEIRLLRQQLQAEHGEVLTSLELQLNQQRLKEQQRKNQFQHLNKETENLKNKTQELCTKLQELQNTHHLITSGTTDGPCTSSDATVIQEHLKDALEKNQQWLVYDQQREMFVRMQLDRIWVLEQQLKQANEDAQLKREETSTAVKQAVEEQKQYYEELLDSAMVQVKVEEEQVVQGRRRMGWLQQQYEGRLQEVEEVKQQLEAERLRGKKKLQEERRCSGGHVEQLHTQLKDFGSRLEKERLWSSELQQQIQASAKDLEKEKRDNLRLQQQLCRVLEKLRKAEDSVARLQSEEEGSESGLEGQFHFSSPVRVHSLQDESFLECPKCKTLYPTSRHRELLAHIEDCCE